MHTSETQSPSFFQRVYDVIAQIPEGTVVSYGQIAHIIGSPRAARQVGWALRQCPDELPWHRVVKADGTVTGGCYADIRAQLLRGEGIPFLEDGRVDMQACQWMTF